MRNQTTIGKEVALQGVGLHTGKQTALRLCPAEADTGIRFLVGDANEDEAVSASPFAVSSTKRATVLRGSNGTEVRTVEHFMAACYGLEIDNLLVRLTGEEMPAGDGSSLHFVHALREAGEVVLTKPRRVAAIASPLWVADGDACLVALPAAMLETTFAVDYPFIGAQLASFAFDSRSFAEALAPARTFGLRREAEQLWANGLAKGASLDNVLVIDEHGYSSPLRFPDEVVRHKTLDLVGDLALIGADLQCRIVAVRSSHRLNNQLARAILSQIESRGRDVDA